MRGHWLGFDFWWVGIGLILLIGFTFLVLILLNPQKHFDNINRINIMHTLDYESMKNKIDQEEYELRKRIIQSEEDEHFENPVILSFLTKYARYEIDSRRYFEIINPLIGQN